MKQPRLVLSSLILATSVYAAQTFAQLSVPISHFLVPTAPTSADNLTLSLNRPCSDTMPYIGNAYTVSMSQNNITVRRGDIASHPVGLCPVSTRDEVDLGRLPAGDYTLTVTNAAVGSVPIQVAVSNFAFTVKDARALKTAPYVRLDYSGHWWDPNDSGWGLFIWHDARDNMLAAWFTYGADGKPIWYVFQPTWQTFAATFSAPISQTSRMPGPTSPPPNPTTYTTVGSASLDFKSKDLVDGAIPYNAGRLTYTLNGGQTIVRNIRRFLQ